MSTRTSTLLVALAFLAIGVEACAESPGTDADEFPDAVLDDILELTPGVPRTMLGEALRTHEGAVILYYDRGTVLGPFLGIEGATYPVPCGNPFVSLFPPSARGFFASESSELSAYVHPRPGEARCELVVDRSRLVTEPFDWSRVRPDGTYDRGGAVEDLFDDDDEDVDPAPIVIDPPHAPSP